MDAKRRERDEASALERDENSEGRKETMKRSVEGCREIGEMKRERRIARVNAIGRSEVNEEGSMGVNASRTRRDEAGGSTLGVTGMKDRTRRKRGDRIHEYCEGDETL